MGTLIGSVGIHGHPETWVAMIVCAHSASQVSVTSLIVSSSSAQAFRQVAHTEELLNFSLRLIKENASRMGQPKIVSAGEILQSGSGLLHFWSRARRRPSLSRDPDGAHIVHQGAFCILDSHLCSVICLGKVYR